MQVLSVSPLTTAYITLLTASVHRAIVIALNIEVSFWISLPVSLIDLNFVSQLILELISDHFIMYHIASCNVLLAGKAPAML